MNPINQRKEQQKRENQEQPGFWPRGTRAAASTTKALAADASREGGTVR